MKGYPKIKKNPLVSMIIAVYNEEKHIGECINALINQSHKKLEIVLTDDGSTDSTVKIIENLAKKNKKVILVKQNHLGMANGWNNSFKHSKGKIVVMLGADMIVEKDFVKKMIKPMIDEDYLGSCHIKEIIGNPDNIWVRAKGLPIGYSDPNSVGNHPANIYLAIRRDAWINSGGASTQKGYDADQSFYDALKVKPKQVDVRIRHYKPESFKEIWQQWVWIGRSMNKKDRIKTFLCLPVFPLYVLYKSYRVFKKDPYPPFILFLPFYNTLKYFAYFIGNFEYSLLGKRER